MKRLFFVRHGFTEGNRNNLFTGQSETPLTDEGKQQAKDAGKTLKSNGHKFDLIIASPLSRAVHTAQHIAEEIGYPVDKLETNPLFVERGFGVLEGTNVDEFRAKNDISKMDEVKGAETVEQLQKRAETALEFLRSRLEDDILVVSHGAFGRALRRVCQGLPHTHEYSPESVRIDNCEIVELI